MGEKRLTCIIQLKMAHGWVSEMEKGTEIWNIGECSAYLGLCQLYSLSEVHEDISRRGMTHHKIIIGDCLQGMKLLDDESVDLVVADPPYGVGKADWDKLELEWLSTVHRCLKQNGSFYVFGSVWWYPLVHVKALDLGFTPQNIICWFYENAMARLTTNYQMQYDPIGYFTKTQPHTFNLDDVRVPYKSQERIKHKIVKDGKVWTPHPLGRKIGNVIDIPALAGSLYKGERTEHPTQKPERLIETFLKASSNEGDTILDPFAGSFTTSKVAKDLNRNSISIEINPDYWHNIGKKRLRYNQPSLDNSVSFEVIEL